ncbi:ATP-binding cassette domain-containing protein [Planomonospora corallina]|uniref:ATP-binding cassette domain-containing protein n=1 Tax=Planomonospora corallina TaxID=1806052 RepID=A0ABV8IJ88_9ACTN
MADKSAVIAAEDVRKNYGDPGGAGLNGFDLRVAEGTVCGLLGPNGAGKTTAVRVLTTLLEMDGGRASVAGFDVRTQGRRVRERIGLVGQYAAVDEILTGRQNLVMFGRLNRLPGAAARRRAGELLERFSLTEAADRPAGGYSGGMRRRLDLAASLVVSPPVLFVDEPTTGLDPAARQEVWQAVRELVDAGTTVLLTTQYLEEADRLADRVCVLARGRVVAEGTPDGLKSGLGGDRIDLVFSGPADTAAALPLAARVASGEPHVDASSHRIGVPVAGRVHALVRLATALDEAGIEPEDIALRRPTLDEVFLHLTGAGPDAPGGPAGAGRTAGPSEAPV